MKILEEPFEGTARVSEPTNYSSSMPEDWNLAQAAHVDLRAMGMPRVNLLLVGTDRVVWNVLEAILMHLDEPIVSWWPGAQLALPPIDAAGTLILHDAGALSRDEQRQLITWMDQNLGRAQVVSTTPRQLLPRVQAGLFNDTLYYRLNTVCMDVSAETEGSAESALG
jgi:hypothetical protein